MRARSSTLAGAPAGDAAAEDRRPGPRAAHAPRGAAVVDEPAEAILNNTLSIPALHESSADVLEWTASWTVLCVRREGRLVAAVRARVAGDAWEIGRLMVAPDLAGQGVGRWLLGRAEDLAPLTVVRFTLFTGRSSTRNIRLYQRAGYQLCEPAGGTAGHIQDAVFLAKPATSR